MPASSAEVIGAVLQSAYRHPSAALRTPPPHRPPKATGTLSDQLTVCGKQVLSSSVEYESAGRQQALLLDSLKTKYVTLTSSSSPATAAPQQAPSTPAMAQAHPKQGQGAKEDQLEEPQVVLWPRDKVTLGWRKTFPPGAGMVNLGNTCYLNSSLQALFHIPALANWLLEELQSHTQRCEANSTNASFCSVCAMMRTLRNTLDRSTPVIKPALIQHKLKCIGKTLMYGRQEDAHEFIKLLLDHMEKSYLSFRHATKLDHRSKETTPLNQIFGGYLRQQVICPLCRYVSTTFSHFQDLVLDIRSVNSVDDALNLHFRKETLDSENAYRCERCHRKVPATKRHLIERAPHVLLIQLKRFTMSGGKIGKHINIQRMIDISRFVSGSGGGGKQGGVGGGGPYQYRLTSMVIHLGGSLHGGHYTAVAEASNGSMFEFDDSSVRSISLQSALLRNPYILFYEMVRRPKDHQQGGIKQVVRQSSEKALIRQNSDGITASSKTLPTSHSASSVTNGYHHNAHHVDSGGGGGGKGNLPPPLPCHKERERLSFALKSTQSRAMLIDPPNSRPSKIILNNSSTSLLGTKNSSPSSSASSSNSSSTPSKSSTFSNSVKSSTSSSSSSPSSSVARSSVLSSSSSASPASKMSISSSKPGLSSSSTKSSLPSSSASMASSTSKSAVQSASSKSSSSTPSLVPYLDDSEDSEVDEGRRGARDKVRANGVKERVSGTAQRVTNGEAGDSDGSTKARGMVPRSLQVVQAGAGKGKVDTGWQVTDAALHSPSESSGGSGSGGRAFTVVEQPVSTSRPDPDPDTQGWTVTKVGEGQTRPQQPPARRPRPELEKSLSHDCVLPSQRGSSGPRSEGDSASLRSKASVDSGRSDRSTKSMKRSLFSLFTCVSSARSPDSPPSPRRSSDAGLPDSASATTTSTAAQDAATARVQDSTASTPDKAKRSREQEDQETEPSSPSKKACQGKVMKDGSKDAPKGSTKDGSREGQSGFPTTTTSTTSTNTTSTTTAASTTTSAPKNGTANSTAQHERKAKNWQQQQQQQGSDVPKNDAGTKNGTSTHQRHPNQQNGTTKSTSSTSTSSLSSSSPSSDSEEEEEEEGGGKWVEKTKEVMGSARLHPSPSVVEWNGAGQRREKERRDGLWDGTRSSAVVDELRRAGNSAYGAEVNAWGGGRSMLDQEAERARREAKKRSADDLYNEEMDSGRMKKMKGQKKGGWGGGSQGPPHSPWNNNNNNNSSNSNGNPFQRLQDARNNGNWNNNNNNNSNNGHHNNHNHHRYNNNNPSYYNNNHHYYHNGNNSNNSYHHGNNPRHHNQYNRGWRRGGGRPKFHHQRKYGSKEKYPKHTW